MRKIGIFTAYQPYVPLNREGLGRLLIYIIGGMLNTGNDVTILCPSWHKGEVKKLLKEHSLEKKVHIKTIFLFPPLLFLLYHFLRRRQMRKIERAVWVQDHKPPKKSIATRVMEIFYASFAGRSIIRILFFGVIFLFLVLLSLPLVLLGIIFRKLIYWGICLIPQRFRNYLHEVSPRNFRLDQFVLNIWGYSRKIELSRMIRYVNHSHIDSWYIPSIFWPEVVKIKKKFALVVPDLVYADFPQLWYHDYAIRLSAIGIDSMLKRRLHFVCYSNYVANHQLAALRDIRRNHIRVIPHGVIDISDHLKQGLSPEEIIQNFLKRKTREVPDREYVRNYAFENRQFILYSSQCRCHKNIKMLLHVLDHLLHEEHVNLKLVLTCANYGALTSLLEELNLTREVIFMPSIPEAVLAALNALAILHVNPSLFEGAFPFTFGEAYSCGTPSVMADIPVTREIVRSEETEHMLFNPFDERDLMAKIKWGMAHRQELLELEKPIFERISQRSWDQVAQEYITAMCYSCQHDKRPTRKRKPWKRS